MIFCPHVPNWRKVQAVRFSKYRHSQFHQYFHLACKKCKRGTQKKSNTVAISRGLYRNWNVKTGVFKWKKILYLKLGEQIAYTRNRNWRPRIRYIGSMIITNT